MLGRSPHVPGISKNASDPIGINLKGRLRRWAINPTPPKRVKAWVDGPLRLEVYRMTRHTRPEPFIASRPAEICLINRISIVTKGREEVGEGWFSTGYSSSRITTLDAFNKKKIGELLLYNILVNINSFVPFFLNMLDPIVREIYAKPFTIRSGLFIFAPPVSIVFC